MACKSKKIAASGGAAQAAEARSCFFDAGAPASWGGHNAEQDPRPKITKVLTRQKLKTTKVVKTLGQPQKLSKVFKVIWLPETLLPDHGAIARGDTIKTLIFYWATPVQLYREIF